MSKSQDKAEKKRTKKLLKIVTKTTDKEINKSFQEADRRIKPKLEDVYKAYKSFLYVENTELIDLVSAVCISRSQTDEKLWVLIVGSSGDRKTEVVTALDDGGINTKIIKSMTAKTLVNGFTNKKVFPDLAPLLQDKIILMPEMASILTLHPNEKAQVWAQLRDLYDGVAGKQSGQGLDILYKNLNVSFIGCSTPVIDNQVLIHQSLGTRELIWRTQGQDKKKLMKKIDSNIKQKDKEEKRKNFKELLQNLIHQRKYKVFDRKEKDWERLQNLAILLCKLRATADIDYYTGELTNFMYPEEPSRLIGQLIVLYNSLKSLDKEYSDERAMSIINQLVMSSCSQTRLKMLLYLLLYPDDDFGRWKLAKRLKIGVKTAYKELNILTHLDMVIRSDVVPDETKPWNIIMNWRLNKDDEVVKGLAKENNILLEVETEQENLH